MLSGAVVLAGGAGRRVGRIAKPALPVGGRALVLRVLDALAGAQARIVVGPDELKPLLPADVLLTREVPAGGGPVAAIAAGLSVLGDLPSLPTDEFVAVVAADLPFLTSDLIAGLHARLVSDEAMTADTRWDGAVPVDDSGQPQWLAGVWRLDRLRARLGDLGDPAGQSVRHLMSGLRIAYVNVEPSSGPPAWFDCDTEDDLRRAEEWARGDIG